jgi:hypothetical protein
MKLDKSQTKFLMTQALIQVGVVAVLALSAFALTGCGKKNTNPPPAVDGPLVLGKTEPGAGDITPDTHDVTIKNGDRLLALILKDKALNPFLAAYQKKNRVVCTRLDPAQIHWECKTSTECRFSLESTCVSNVTATGSNDEIRRLSILGEGNSAKMTYKISDPAQTAAESKIQKIKFEYQR